MIRVTITQNCRGEITKICADEPIELYYVNPHIPNDRNYLCDDVEVGARSVDAELGGVEIGHQHDGTFAEDGEPMLPKLGPSIRTH